MFWFFLSLYVLVWNECTFEKQECWNISPKSANGIFNAVTTVTECFYCSAMFAHWASAVMWGVITFCIYLSTRGSHTRQEWANSRYAVSTTYIPQLVLLHGWRKRHSVPGHCHCHGHWLPTPDSQEEPTHHGLLQPSQCSLPKWCRAQIRGGL